MQEHHIVIGINNPFPIGFQACAIGGDSYGVWALKENVLLLFWLNRLFFNCLLNIYVHAHILMLLSLLFREASYPSWQHPIHKLITSWKVGTRLLNVQPSMTQP